MQNQDWNIRGRSDICQICEREFEDNEEFTTLLSRGEEGFRRTDICNTCRDAEDRREGAISIWKSVFRLPPPKEEEPLKKETSETLLRKLLETEEESKRDVIFVLAVDLERRRIFEEKDIELLENGEKKRIYEHKKTGEVFIVHDPNLDLRELEEVQGQVLELLLQKDTSQKDEDNTENPSPETEEAETNA